MTEAGFTEQQQSYSLMQQAAGVAAKGEEASAQGYEEEAQGADATSIISGVAGLASIGAAFAVL